MARSRSDFLTTDLFALPEPVEAAQGSLACREEIAGVMSDAIEKCPLDRYKIAAEMSRLLRREITKFMLDAYTSESRTTQMPPIDTAIAFDFVVGGFPLITLYARKLGCKVVVGSEVLLHELGRIEHEETELAKRKKVIKKHLDNQR